MAMIRLESWSLEKKQWVCVSTLGLRYHFSQRDRMVVYLVHASSMAFLGLYLRIIVQESLLFLGVVEKETRGSSMDQRVISIVLPVRCWKKSLSFFCEKKMTWPSCSLIWHALEEKTKQNYIALLSAACQDVLHPCDWDGLLLPLQWRWYRSKDKKSLFLEVLSSQKAQHQAQSWSWKGVLEHQKARVFSDTVQGVETEITLDMTILEGVLFYQTTASTDSGSQEAIHAKVGSCELILAPQCWSWQHQTFCYRYQAEPHARLCFFHASVQLKAEDIAIRHEKKIDLKASLMKIKASSIQKESHKVDVQCSEYTLRGYVSYGYWLSHTSWGLRAYLEANRVILDSQHMVFKSPSQKYTTLRSHMHTQKVFFKSGESFLTIDAQGIHVQTGTFQIKALKKHLEEGILSIKS